MTIREPEGVTLEDRESDRLRFERTFLVLDGCKWRTMTLRVGRGTIRDATPDERKAAMRTLASQGGKARASKLTKEQRSEWARRTNAAMTPEQRTERASKAGNARWGKG